MSNQLRVKTFVTRYSRYNRYRRYTLQTLQCDRVTICFTLSITLMKAPHFPIISYFLMPHA